MIHVLREPHGICDEAHAVADGEEILQVQCIHCTREGVPEDDLPRHYYIIMIIIVIATLLCCCSFVGVVVVVDVDVVVDVVVVVVVFFSLGVVLVDCLMTYAATHHHATSFIFVTRTSSHSVGRESTD